MNSEPKDKYFGIPLSEWIVRVPNELPVDAIGLWQIIPFGEDAFGLTGYDLEDFAKRCIVELVVAGAKPVMPSLGRDVMWEHQPQYGVQPQEIATNVVNEWRKDPTLTTHDGLWFDLLDGQFARRP